MNGGRDSGRRDIASVIGCDTVRRVATIKMRLYYFPVHLQFALRANRESLNYACINKSLITRTRVRGVLSLRNGIAIEIREEKVIDANRLQESFAQMTSSARSRSFYFSEIRSAPAWLYRERNRGSPFR